MQKYLLALFFGLAFTWSGSMVQAQYSSYELGEEIEIPSDAERQLRQMIDESFMDWSRSWSWDKYNSKSVSIDEVHRAKSSKYLVIAIGGCSFNRMGNILRLRYAAYFDKNGALVKLCYLDNSAGQQDCKYD